MHSISNRTTNILGTSVANGKPEKLVGIRLPMWLKILCSDRTPFLLAAAKQGAFVLGSDNSSFYQGREDGSEAWFHYLSLSVWPGLTVCSVF